MSKSLQEHNYHSIDATIIADSLSPHGHRLTTYVLTFPRFILTELLTHRLFSRNSASSRAIPFKKMVESVKTNPFVPIAWQKDHSGMQGSEYLVNSELHWNWIEASEQAIRLAETLNGKGVTKQLCNRLLEPFLWHTVIVTASEFDNFFELRCPQYEVLNPHGRSIFFKSRKDYISYVKEDLGENTDHLENWNDLEWLSINKGAAEIHLSTLAEKMWDAYNESKPKQLEAGQWHIPFGDTFNEVRLLSIVDNYNSAENQEELLEKAKVKIATARCARVSYLNFDGSDDYEADINLYDRLSKMSHYSPFEHCAKAMDNDEHPDYFVQQGNWIGHGWCKNFRGFIQERFYLENSEA